jgi:parvulin-like peptidyl-prolyl isomerase
VARVFGGEFAERVKAMAVGGWQGPVPSSFGLHLVEVTRHDAGRTVPLSAVRDRVERDLSRARTEQTNADFYNKLRSSYAVRIEDDDARLLP